MPCSINFSMTLQTEIYSKADFLEQMIILKSCISVFEVLSRFDLQTEIIARVTSHFLEK